jgi:hypothetical protein
MQLTIAKTPRCAAFRSSFQQYTKPCYKKMLSVYRAFQPFTETSKLLDLFVFTHFHDHQMVPFD